MNADQPEPPLLRVVHGDPTDAELAALLAVVGAWPAAREAPAAERPSSWGDPARAVRRPPAVGPGGWRASALPG